MNVSQFNPRLLGSSVLLAAAMAVAASVPAMASTSSVTQVLSAGVFTATITSLTLPPISVSNAPQTPTGHMTVTADDSRGGASGGGWSVTTQASDFAYTGVNGGTAIPAANFGLTAAAQPVMVAGQPWDLTGGPNVPPTLVIGSLDVARIVMITTAAFGQGTYTQDLSVSLLVPASSKVGTYTGTLTTTNSTTP